MALPNKKKELTYSSYDEFHKKSNYDFSTLDFNKPAICNSLLKLYDEGIKCLDSNDDEKAYIILLRFFEGFVKLKDSKLYKQDKSFVENFISKDKLIKSMGVLEKLKVDIKNRYEEREKLKQEKESIQTNDKSVESQNKKTEVTNGFLFKNFINPCELTDLIRKNLYKILVIDIRNEQEFMTSHMNLDLLLTDELKQKQLFFYLNISENLIETTSWNMYDALAKKDPFAAKVFSERNDFDYIILFDKNSNFQKLKPDSKLLILKRAIYEFDTEKVKNEPIILDGGWSQWLVYYPAYKSTSINIKIDSSKIIQDVQKDSIKNKFNFEYPEITAPPQKPIENLPKFEVVPTKIQIEPEIQKEQNLILKPIIDRSSKPFIKNEPDAKIEPIQKNIVTIPIINRLETETKKIDEPDVSAPTLKQFLPINTLSRVEKPDFNQIENSGNPLNDIIFKTIYAPSRARVIHTPFMKEGANKVLNHETGLFSYQSNSISNSKPQSIKPPKAKPEPKSSPGLKRTFSSPNIANIEDISLDEDKENKEIYMKSAKLTSDVKPVINRTNKPMSENFMQSRIEELQPVYSKTHPGLTGIRNLGNTCFMNSIIQCLSNTEMLVKYFLEGKYKSDLNRKNDLGFKGEIADEFSVIVHSIWGGHCRVIAPRRFRYLVGEFNQQFVSNEQQDAQEFLLFLLDGLHEDLNRVKQRPKLTDKDNENEKLSDNDLANLSWRTHILVNNSIIVDLFQGQFKSTVTCTHCDKKSIKFDAFMYLTLPIFTSKCNVYDCLELFLRLENMSGESKWKCPNCKEYRDATKKIDIWKLPPLLIIHLKRFKYEGVWRDKITSNVEYPIENLNLNKYLSGPKRPNVTNNYKLYGISNHSGTMDGGHYTSMCRNFELDRWFKYDDSEVKEVTSLSALKSPTSYILFYSRC